MKYQVNEIFYSLQGEGVWTGQPMLFIRLSGCNLKCHFCDTPDRQNYIMSTGDIIEELKDLSERCDRVLITGGEPLIQPLDLLIEELGKEFYKVHIETNGTQALPSTPVEWITVSPKTVELNAKTVRNADEIKFLYGKPYSQYEEVIERVIFKYWAQPDVKMYIMPVADGMVINQENVKAAVEYCKRHPSFSLCMQMHKVLNLK